MSTDSQTYRHMIFMLQAIEFLINKVTDLYRIQSQQELPRKKSIIRIYDKSIERLPPPQFTMENIQLPSYEEN